ncbi:hypothetical protein [Candidatus Berkiella aquae]|uniref:Uncharacterized protein n=1 Tax=Candidatus Berkiella aquae TaxID=295108 RepID=A0A0Q9Z1F0_9GAMM|nr:hypothetical protein [Candidatus Berkiella aquae]MCS5711760.1 hypothetical protein [Candidatus Berkiella aquae]
MAMLFSGQIRKESPNVDQVLKQAEAGTHPDALLIKNGQQLVATIPDRVLAPSTASSIEFDRQANHLITSLNSAGSKPKI